MESLDPGEVAKGEARYGVDIQGSDPFSRLPQHEVCELIIQERKRGNEHRLRSIFGLAGVQGRVFLQ